MGRDTQWRRVLCFPSTAYLGLQSRSYFIFTLLFSQLIDQSFMHDNDKFISYFLADYLIHRPVVCTEEKSINEAYVHSEKIQKVLYS